MFQGGRSVEARNREAFIFDPRSIDFVLLTQAHIDERDQPEPPAAARAPLAAEHAPLLRRMG